MGKRSRSSSSASSSSASSSLDRDEIEQREREKNREEVMKRKKQFQTESDDDSSASSEPSKKKKKSSKKDKKKKHKKDKKKKHKKDKKKKSKKDKKHMKDKDPTSTTGAVSMNTFGARGICRESDFHKHQRGFEVWMAEVQGIPSFTGSKYELKEYFKTFAEDFNTCSFPHEKFYNYDKWEMDDYRRQQALLASGESMTGVDDEARHRTEMRAVQEKKKKQELNDAMARMSKDKIAEMRGQDLLRAEMTNAFKYGDSKAVEKMKKRLEPEDKRTQGGPAHPWGR